MADRAAAAAAFPTSSVGQLSANPAPSLSAGRHLDIGVLLLGRALAMPSGPDAPTLARVEAHARVTARGSHRVEGERLALTAELLRGDLERGRHRLASFDVLAPRLAPRVRLDAARLLVESGHVEAAEAVLPDRASDARADAGFQGLATAALDRARGRLEDAHRRLLGLRRRHAWWTALEEELARTAWEAGDLEGAVARFAEIRRREPSSCAAQTNWVLALYGCGRREEGEAAYRASRPRVRADPELRRWISASVPAAPAPSPAAALTGELGAIPLTDVISLLGHSRASGALVLEGPEGQGEVWLRDGKLVDAHAPGAPSGDARSEGQLLLSLETFLDWGEGSFRFEAGRRPPTAPEPELALEAPVALLHACASLDERKRREGR
jgi:hypothetical protein